MKPSYRQLIYYSTLIMLTSIIVLTFCFSEDPIETFVVNYWWLLASVGIMMAVSGVIFLVYEACQRLDNRNYDWTAKVYINSLENEWGPVLDALAMEGEEE